ncbi:MAG: hypothetical protein RLY78_4270 [Pseudomonadota bacterium]
MHLSPPTPRQRFFRRSLTTVFAFGASALAVQAQTNAVSPPAPLSSASRPEPSNLSSFVADKAAAIALGKALFWDLRLGSDGKTACASCHFSAGADPRSKNQLSAGTNGAGSAAMAQLGGPNYQFKASDFPLHQLSDPGNRDSAVLRSLSVVAGSQGVPKEQFQGIQPGQGADLRQPVYDPVFHVGALNTRQVTGRNAPSVINAVFNLRNFWDGRAQTVFNGVNGWGKRDSSARVYKTTPVWTLSGWQYRPQATSVVINDASLASQAVGPVLNPVEMTAAGRIFPDLGRKMMALRPLAGQAVAADDSVLGARRHASGDGLSAESYATLVRTAFRPEWWNATSNLTVDGKSYNQAEANFSLFFGLALQLYQATLVSDQTPYDRYLQGQSAALTTQQQQGFALFVGKGQCINCHGGAALTNASIHRRLVTDRMSRMTMGDGRVAVYDEGFYNIGVTRTSDDPGVGGKDPFGYPLSYSGLSKRSLLLFNAFELAIADEIVTPLTRIAVNGAFKTPGLRNVALTAPYFHNGGMATLEQVVEFYNRGGNFARANIADLDADIKPLGMTAAERASLVAFLKGLTDDRVRRHAAPFDHPSLVVHGGHVGDTSAVSVGSDGRAADASWLLPAIGRGGYDAARIPARFLGLN